MTTCDLNCDMGEGIGNDAAIMPFISSANIACGYHAGDATSMRSTILLAKQTGVAIGAHPSFADRVNFGRTEMILRPQEVYDLVTSQIQIIDLIAKKCDTNLHHVKPHGALYNMAAKDQQLAMAIAHAVYDFNKLLVVYGLSGSYLVTESDSLGIRTASEVFADRTYQPDGSLTPRSQPDALITDETQAVQQVLTMLNEGHVISVTGSKVPLKAETICLHSDGEHAERFARLIQQTLTNEGIILRSI